MREEEHGRLTWLSSDEDSGPDCGLILGLGDSCSLYVGELADSTIAEAGINPADHEGIGWWVSIHTSTGFQVIGPVLDQEAGRVLVDQLFAAIRQAPKTKGAADA